MRVTNEKTLPTAIEDEPLSLKLADRNTSIIVDGQLKISFRRTIRVPDNEQSSALPPDLGAFKLTNVNYGSGRLPAAVKAKGGLLLPMYQREAMWVKFTALTKKSYAIKILAGGVNAISGEPDIETSEVKQRQRDRLAQRKSIQDYVVVPGQPWLDGFATGPGKVQQFVATGLGKDQTVEAQITGVEDIGGLQFDVTPQKSDTQTSELSADHQNTIQLFVRTLTGKVIKIHALASWEIGHVCAAIQDKEGIPPDQQRLVFAGKRITDNPDLTLAQYGVTDGSTVNLNLRLRGGGDPGMQPPAEMGLAAGGEITQSIVKDHMPSDCWERSRTVGFNVQIVNAELYYSLTGLPNPNPPISQQTYMAHGGVFFTLDEDQTGIHGDFPGVKTLGQLTGQIDEHSKPPTKKISLIPASLKPGENKGMDNGKQSSHFVSESAGKYSSSAGSTEPSDIQRYPQRSIAFRPVGELYQELR